MSLQDSLFAEEVENDITLFSKDARRKRVLVFPPVNNYRRFIIHRLVQDRFIDLKTFSIGQGLARRTVVCYQSDVIRDPKLNGVPSRTCVELTDSFSPETAPSMIGVDESRRSPGDSTSPEHARMRQVKTSPVVQIYRPPGARRGVGRDGQPSSAATAITDVSSTSAKSNRQRRPDRAVYVPKHRRSTEVDDGTQTMEEIIAPCRSRCNRTRTSSPPENETFRKQSSSNDHDAGNEPSSGELCDKRIMGIASLESSDRIGELRVTPLIRDESNFTNISQKTQVSSREDYSSSSAEEKSVLTESPSLHQRNSEQTVSRSSSTSDKDDIDNTTFKTNVADKSIEPFASNDAKRNNNIEIIRECTTSSGGSSINKSVDHHEHANNKNLRTANTRVVSNVLIISDEKERVKEETIISIDKENATMSMNPPEKKPKKIARVKSKPASPPSPPIKLNRDECDWDSLFDDNGECLDPTLIEELTAAVGQVTIEQPKNDYKAFSRPVEVSNDEFGHVVEIYNFPSDLKTSDLAAVFSPWKNGGFELKWVDDTHCLGVFSSSLVAAEVLSSDHPFVKTRPLSAATSLSKTKARKSAEFLQPYKSRPETCAALARRLVTGALGVKLATARQEREQEKVLLREAKEKRRLANKQREDVWEGIIAEK